MGRSCLEGERPKGPKREKKGATPCANDSQDRRWRSCCYCGECPQSPVQEEGGRSQGNGSQDRLPWPSCPRRQHCPTCRLCHGCPACTVPPMLCMWVLQDEPPRHWVIACMHTRNSTMKWCKLYVHSNGYDRSQLSKSRALLALVS